MNTAILNSLELMWKGMLSIFVVIAAIFVVVMVMNRIKGKRSKKTE